MDTTYKIIEDQAGRTVNKGDNGDGLSEAAAAAGVNERNAEAERLGIKTRYATAVLIAGDEPEALAEAA